MKNSQLSLYSLDAYLASELSMSVAVPVESITNSKRYWLVLFFQKAIRFTVVLSGLSILASILYAYSSAPKEKDLFLILLAFPLFFIFLSELMNSLKNRISVEYHEYLSSLPKSQLELLLYIYMTEICFSYMKDESASEWLKSFLKSKQFSGIHKVRISSLVAIYRYAIPDEETIISIKNYIIN